LIRHLSFDKIASISPAGDFTFMAKDGSTRQVSILAASIPIGRWHHIVAKWGGNDMSLWLNGVRVVSGGICGNTTATYANPNLYVAGGSLSATYGRLDGSVDEVAFFSTALNDQQVLEIFTAGAAELTGDNARVTQVVGEVLRDSGVVQKARMTQLVGEVVRDSGVAKARMTQLVIEVVRSSSTNQIYNRTISDTLTFTQTATAVHVHNRTLSQTLTFTEATHRIIDRAISQTLTFTETIAKQMLYNRSISQTLPLVQSVSTKNVHEEAISQTLTFTQTAAFIHQVLRSQSQLLSFTQSAISTVIHNQSVSQTLTFTQTVQSNIKAENVSQTLIFTQSSSVGKIRTRSISDVLTFTQTTEEIAELPECDSAMLGAANAQLGLMGLADICDVTDSADEVTQTINFTETIVLRRILSRSIAQSLSFVQTPGLKRIYSRSLSQQLKFAEGYFQKPVRLGGGISGVGGTGVGTLYPSEHQTARSSIALPVAIIEKASPVIVLRSDSGTITLPPPQFSDVEGLSHKVNLKRSMNGRTYTYIKSCDTRKLKYTFWLSRFKAEELRRWIIKSSSQEVLMSNWKAERWIVKITLNPVDFEFQGVWSGTGSNREKVAVTLDFEGVKLYG
jgi:hypothetical protein